MPDKYPNVPEGHQNIEAYPEIKDSPEKMPSTEIVNRFNLPDQIDALDFKKFLETPLFDSSFYLYKSPEGDSFRQLVQDPSEPFNGIKGGEFQEVRIVRKSSETDIKSELDIKPISLNEWRYLFSKLTLEQMYGRTYYVVQTEDNVPHTIKVQLSRDGGGPYNYTISFGEISSETLRAPSLDGPYDELEPRIFMPVNKSDKV